jgi:hypothetical protein
MWPGEARLFDHAELTDPLNPKKRERKRELGRIAEALKQRENCGAGGRKSILLSEGFQAVPV